MNTKKRRKNYKIPDGLKAWRKKEKKRYIRRMTSRNDLHVHFYMIKMFGNGEVFIKIGISVDISQRYKGCPYEYKVLVRETMLIDEAWEFESYCLNKLYSKGVKYNPIINIQGHTECFRTSAVLILQTMFADRGFMRID